MDTKICTICKEELPKTDEFFAARYDRKEKAFQSNCRNCQKIYRKEHYEKNKDKYIAKAKTHNKKVYDWFQEIRKEFKCSSCGESRWWVLDFHHLNPKEKDNNIAHIIHYGSKNRVLREMEKCSILCSNCHRDLHHKEKQAL